MYRIPVIPEQQQVFYHGPERRYACSCADKGDGLVFYCFRQYKPPLWLADSQNIADFLMEENRCCCAVFFKRYAEFYYGSVAYVGNRIASGGIRMGQLAEIDDYKLTALEMDIVREADKEALDSG